MASPLTAGWRGGVWRAPSAQLDLISPTAATSTPSSSSFHNLGPVGREQLDLADHEHDQTPGGPAQPLPAGTNRVALASGVRIPASFTIPAWRPLTPAVISVPTGSTIELQVRNLDSHGHSIRVDAPAARTVSVSPARAPARRSPAWQRQLPGAGGRPCGVRIVVGSQPGLSGRAVNASAGQPIAEPGWRPGSGRSSTTAALVRRELPGPAP